MTTLELEISDLLITEPDDLLGQVIDGYVVEERVGAGLMGDVYRCQSPRRREEVAVKVLRASWSSNREAVLRFEREARAASAIEHPGVVRTLHAGRLADGRHYMITEFCRGISIREVLQSRGRLPLVEALALVRQITLAVEAAHGAGVVHRDLKPENVMLIDQRPEHSVEHCKIKLLDFGLARLQEQSGSGKLTAQHMVLGTPKYMAPEQVGGAAEADFRADLYSLGVLLYELLCGRPPFMGDTMELLRHHIGTPPVAPSLIAPQAGIPPEVDELVLRLLAKDPAQRPQPASRVAKTLEILAAPMQLSAAATGEFTALLANMVEHDPVEQARADAMLGRVLQADLEYQHGQRLIDQGKFAEAEAILRRCVEGNPEPEHRVALAWATYNNPANPKAALQETVLLSLLTALRERPQLVSGHCHLGEVFLDAGQSARALASFQRALKLDPTNVRAQQGKQRATSGT